MRGQKKNLGNDKAGNAYKFPFTPQALRCEVDVDFEVIYNKNYSFKSNI